MIMRWNFDNNIKLSFIRDARAQERIKDMKKETT